MRMLVSEGPDLLSEPTYSLETPPTPTHYHLSFFSTIKTGLFIFVQKLIMIVKKKKIIPCFASACMPILWIHWNCGKTENWITAKLVILSTYLSLCTCCTVCVTLRLFWVSEKFELVVAINSHLVNQWDHLNQLLQDLTASLLLLSLWYSIRVF